MRTEDVYLLTAHEPYRSPEHAAPVNATIVHALTLLHPAVPQPDGGRMYRCLTEVPSRTVGCLIPLSTLTFELDGGNLWPEVADWEAVSAALVAVSRAGKCDSMNLGLPDEALAVLTGGPGTVHHVFCTDGRQWDVGPPERQGWIEKLTGHVRRYTATGPFWPGDDLTAPPTEPAVMPYKPWPGRT